MSAFLYYLSRPEIGFRLKLTFGNIDYSAK